MADGWHEYGRWGKPNRFQKVVVGLNPIISVIDGFSVLHGEKSLYGEPAEHPIDIGFAVVNIVTPINPGKSFLKSSAGTVIDATLNVSSSVHNSGALDNFKK